MTLRRPMLLLALPLMGCAPEIDLQAEGLAPEPVILSPTDGVRVPRGGIPAFGRVSDQQDPPYRLFATWGVRDRTGGWRDVCSGFAEEDGTTRCLAQATPGDDALRLHVVDLAGFQRTSTIAIDVVDQSPPEITLDGPEPEDGPQYADHPVGVRAVVDDEEDGLDALVLAWTSSLQGALNGPVRIDRLGLVAGALDLVEGVHDVTVSVSDPFGLSASDTLRVLVGGDNERPICRVDAPVPGAVQQTGSAWSVRGYGHDPEWNDASVEVVVRSDVDGVLARGAPSGPSVFAYEDLVLTRGEHTLTVSVEDHVGARCVREIPVTVDDPPVLSVTAPTADLAIPSGGYLPVDVLLDHPTKDPADLRLRITSDLTGAFSVPVPDEDGRVQATLPIQPGNHRLTLRAVDADDLQSAAVVREVAAGVAR